MTNILGCVIEANAATCGGKAASSRQNCPEALLCMEHVPKIAAATNGPIILQENIPEQKGPPNSNWPPILTNQEKEGGLVRQLGRKPPEMQVIPPYSTFVMHSSTDNGVAFERVFMPLVSGVDFSYNLDLDPVQTSRVAPSLWPLKTPARLLDRDAVPSSVINTPNKLSNGRQVRLR